MAVSPASTPIDLGLMTITEAAAALRVPTATLRYWRHMKKGPHGFRLGRRVLYRRSDLDAWILGRSEPA